MAVTTVDKLINPQVMGDMIDAKVSAQLKLTPYAKVDTSLVGVPGDTKTVPSWNYIGDAEDVGENTEIDYTAMSASSVEFKIGKAGKGVALTTESINSNLGDPKGQAAAQLAKAIAGKVDGDVLAKAYSTPMIVDKSDGAIGYKAIVDCVTKFEDEEDGIDKVMFIHPNQEATLLKDDNFISRDKFTGDVTVTGAIGKVAGCWIKKSKKVRQIAAANAVQGVYTIKIEGTVADTDKITIDGVVCTLTSGDNTPAKAVTTIKGKTFENYTVTGASDTLTFTEKSGKEGHGVPLVSSTGAENFVSAVTTQGSAAHGACWECPIIKLQPDSAETEYTEDELPAITIFLKKDTTFNAFYNQDFDRVEMTAYKYYGVALTNAAKVVVGRFGV